jgi:hypothetical protein
MLPLHIHLIDIICGISLKEGIVWVLNQDLASLARKVVEYLKHIVGAAVDNTSKHFFKSTALI